MKPTTIVFLLAAWTVAVAATASPSADDTKAANQASVKPVSDTSASGKETTEFKPPRGFTARKRGKIVVYCSTITPVGTRLRSETCYDEPQMREYMIQLEENKSSIDRIRSGCNYTHDCGQTDALARKTK